MVVSQFSVIDVPTHDCAFLGVKTRICIRLESPFLTIHYEKKSLSALDVVDRRRRNGVVYIIYHTSYVVYHAIPLGIKSRKRRGKKGKEVVKHKDDYNMACILPDKNSR